MSAEEALESLLEALQARRTDILKALLDHLGGEAGTVLGRHCGKHGTLLHHAVECSHRDAIRTLLQAGADPGVRNSAGHTALDLAAGSTRQLFSDELLRAVAAGEVGRVEGLLAAGLGPAALDSPVTRNSALHWAASFGPADLTSLLLTRGFPADPVNADGCTPLHDAVQRGDPQIVQLLLEAGADHTAVAVSGKLKGKSPSDLAQALDLIRPLFEERLKGCSPASSPASPLSPSSLRLESCDVTEPGQQAVVAPEPEQVLHPAVAALWPPPRLVRQLPGPPPLLPATLHLSLAPLPPGLAVHTVLQVVESYAGDLGRAGLSLAGPGPDGLHLALAPDLAPEEYSLVLSGARARVRAGGLAGLHHACRTLTQLLLHPASPAPALLVRDRPEMSVRGVLLDLAGRLPAPPLLSHLLHQLSRLKLNLALLFCRLAAVPGWQLPLQPAELIALDRECWARQLELAPVLDLQTSCAWSALPNLTPAFTQVLACFSPRSSLHLGPTLSSVVVAAAAHLGGAAVFPVLPGLLGAAPATTIILCNNSLTGTGQSNLLDTDLPPNLGLVEYGFQADHPFDTNLATAAATGCGLSVCAGTAAWGCLVGRPATMISNLRAAAGAAVRAGAGGLVVASWADSGPTLSPLTAALPGWLLGLGLAWNPAGALRGDTAARVAGAVGHHLLGGEEAGRALLDLGRVEEGLGAIQQNSPLLGLLAGRGLGPDLLAPKLGRAVQETKRALTLLAGRRAGGGGEAEPALQELQLAGELLLLAARLARGLVGAGAGVGLDSLPSTLRTDMANKLLLLTEQHRAVWLSRYLPAGLSPALLSLTDLLATLSPGQSS